MKLHNAKNMDEQISDWEHIKATSFKAIIPLPDIDIKGIARPLHIRGIILDHPQSGCVVFLLWDHLRAFTDNGNIIRDRVASVLDIPRTRVLLTTTHTHSGHPGYINGSPDYINRVADIAANAAKHAIEHFEPVRAGWISVKTEGITQNRNAYLKNGGAYTERWAIPATWNVPAEDILKHGPSDNEVRILILKRMNHSCLAILSNFSCHNSAALTDKSISDDFFGIAMELVEQTVGSSCTTLITPGSIGDQDPTGSIELGGDRSNAYASKLGRDLANYILNAIKDVKMHDTFPMQFISETIKIDIRKDWLELAKDKANPAIQKYVAEKSATAEINAVRIGEFAVVTAPCELYTLPAQIIRKNSPFPITSFMSLTNGQLFYVPEKEAYQYADIYSIKADIAGMVKPGTDKLIYETATRILLHIFTNKF